MSTTKTHDNSKPPLADAIGSDKRATKCPQCGASVVQCRCMGDYCENCGWPDENRGAQPYNDPGDHP